MPKLVDIAGYGQVSFPDDMTEEQIGAAIEAEMGQQGAAPSAAVIPATAPITGGSPSRFMAAIDRVLKPYASPLAAATEAFARPGALTEQELLALPQGELAQGLDEGLQSLIPKTVKDAAVLAGVVGTTIINPLAGGALIAGMGAAGAGTAAGELSVSIPQGEIRDTARAGTQLAANALMLKGGTAVIPRRMAAVEAALETKRLLVDEQTPLPPAGIAEPVKPTDSLPAYPSGDALGISPSLSSLGPTHKPGDYAVAAAKEVNRAYRGLAEQFEMMSTKDSVAAGSDAVKNKANIYAKQVANDVRLDVIGRTQPSNRTFSGLVRDMFTEAERLDLQAMTPIVEAGGDLARLTADATKVIGTPEVSAALKRVYDHALSNFTRLAPKAQRVVNAFDTQIMSERAAGMNTDYAENYVTHRYDFDVMLGPNKPVIIDASNSSGLGGSRFYSKSRVFPSYADAITARDALGNFKGLQPRTLDIADLLEHRIRAGQRTINARAWAEGLRGVDSPVTRTPLVQDLITQPNGARVAPLGYQPFEPVPGMHIALNDTIAPLIKDLTSASGVPRWITKPIAFSKHILLAVDTFHAARMAYRGAGQGQFGHTKGLSLLEYTDRGLTEAVRAGEITSEVAAWARANKPVAELLQDHGLNVGRIGDALYKDVVNAVPGVGKFTKWVFDKLTRGLMAQTGVAAFKRNQTLYPHLSAAEVARKTAKEINTYYGNLMSQGIFRSARSQDMARIAFLAPQWVESLARTEAGAVAQAGSAVLDAARLRKPRVGTLAKGVGTSTLGFFVFNQLLNHFTQGGFTWETNPEGRQLDAYVPDWIEGSNGYWMSPLGTTMELTHDYMRYRQEGQGEFQAITTIVGNKAGQAPRVAAAFAGRTLGEGKPLVDTSDRVKQMGAEMFPGPLGLKAFQNSYLGSKQRQAFGSVGIKIEKARTGDEEERAARGRAFARYEDVVEAAVRDVRKNPEREAEVMAWAERKLDEKQWKRARKEILRRGQRR